MPALRVAILVSAGNSGTAASSAAASGVRLAVPSGRLCASAREVASSAASLGFFAFQASKVLVHAAWAAPSSFCRAEKNARTSGETKYFSAGNPSAWRAASPNLAPPSPCAFCVPSTSGIPLPMSVLAMIACGLPLPAFLARTNAG